MELRTFTNVPGITFDAEKTDVIFAEDMNEIKARLEAGGGGNLNYRGTYSGSETYNTNDVVLYDGSSYICKTDGVNGWVPTNTDYWDLFVSKGTDGTDCN